MQTIRCLLRTDRNVEMPLTLLVAATPQEQQQGYRGRPPPADDSSGILFFFREPARAVFNMRGVPFDLELCAGSADGTILGGSAMAANSPVEYAPSDPIRFAIELRGGWTSRNGLPVRMSIP